MTQWQKKFELDGKENSDFLEFLAREEEKIVNLDRILGIGGEGVVLRDKVWTREYDYKTQLGKKEKKDVAIKFVKFEKNDEDDFEAPEDVDFEGTMGGITKEGLFVTSSYFAKMMTNLGDFGAATGGYAAPYADFAISEIHKKSYFIIGKPYLSGKSSC